MKLSFPSRSVPAVLTTSLAAFALAACGGSSDSSTSSSTQSAAATATKDAKIAAMVPANLQGKPIAVALDASYPPMELFDKDGKTIIGLDADLAAALATTMGLKANPQNVTFDSIIPGIEAGKYSLGMSSFTDTKVREKTVDFVTYLNVGTAIYVTAASGAKVNTVADLCGLTVAVEKGTTQQDAVEKQAKACSADKKLTVLVFPDQNGANLALSSGRAQVGLADAPVAAWAVKESGGKFKAAGTSFAQSPYGIAMAKDSGLSKPVQEALKVLIGNGVYKSILAKWDMAASAITDPTVNGATS